MGKYTISPIQTPEEGKKTRAVAIRVFGWGAGLFLPRKPEWGFYAHDADKTVGGVFMEKVGPGEGMLSWIFVDPQAQGHKLGAGLLEAGIKAMDEKGLKTQFSLVRSDNTASWNMFAKQGYKRPSVLKFLFEYSLKGFLTRLSYSFAAGYSAWVRDEALEAASIHPKGWALVKSLLFALFTGMALSLFSLRGADFFFVGMATVLGITILRMVVAYPLARMSGPVRFDSPQGGTTLSVVLALAFGSWWPSFGSFVPLKDFWSDRVFARYNSWQAFAAWMSMVLVSVGLNRFYPELFHSGLGHVLDLVIIYQLVPFFPLDNMDGGKVLRYSKVLYAVGLVLSLLAIVVF